MPERPPTRTDLPPDMRALQETVRGKIERKEFRENEPMELVRERAEIIHDLLPELPGLAKTILERYRAFLAGHGITKADTGALSCYLVGGRAHGQSSLKSWSDFDLIIAGENPFGTLDAMPGNDTRERAEARLEHLARSNRFKEIFDAEIQRDFAAEVSTKLGRELEFTKKGRPESDMFEIEGFGSDRSGHVEGGVLLASE